jgi:alpha-amylase
MDYETFGEHHWEETGIFKFLEHLPQEVLRHNNLSFRTPTEVVRGNEAKDSIDIPWAISWADLERDSSAWLGNPMQQTCFSELMSLGPAARRAGGKVLETWRKLQTSDHLYYLSTKGMGDGDVHCYFNRFDSPYEAFINYMNIINDFKGRVMEVKNGRSIEESRLFV